MIDGDQESYEKVSRVEFDFKQLLLVHLSNISKLISYNFIIQAQNSPQDLNYILGQSDELTTRNYARSVDVLGVFLSPYFDDKYKKEIEGWKESKIDKWEKYTWKFSALLGLMERKNFLLEIEESDVLA